MSKRARQVSPLRPRSARIIEAQRVSNFYAQRSSCLVTMLLPELQRLVALNFLDPASRVMLSFSCRYMNDTLGLLKRKAARENHIIRFEEQLHLNRTT